LFYTGNIRSKIEQGNIRSKIERMVTEFYQIFQRLNE